MTKKEEVQRDLMRSRIATFAAHGNTGDWDVGDVMAVLDDHDLFPDRRRKPQHIDLHKERELANVAGWGFSLVAWLFSVIAIVRQSKPWAVAAAVTWVQGNIIAAYERMLDDDIEASSP